MTAPICSDEEFMAIWNDKQSGARVAEALGIGVRTAMRRRRTIEAKHGMRFPVSTSQKHFNTARIDQKALATLKIDDGVIIVGSDIHLWPGERTVAQKAFVRFIKEFKPFATVVNGDVLDSASNNRHDRIGWSKRPSLKEELEVVTDFLDELVRASPSSKRFWPAGNHDLNFESRISNLAPQYEGVQGVHLKDHFPMWIPCWRIDVNDDVVIKHRWANGIHAVYNNTLRSGKSFITGHLHSLKVTPWSDYTGTRYGVDTGTLAEPYADQFASYTELNPVNWRSGFVVLTFKKGRMLMPELVQKFDDEHVEFRGELIRV